MSWEQMAIEMAKKHGVPAEVVLSTIKAETGGRNIVGGATGQAIGYGQVYVRWWYQQLVDSAKNFGISLPTLKPVPGTGYIVDDRTHAQIKDMVTSDDQLSMDWAVRVIKSVWDSSGGDYTAFVKKYVGPAVPVAEIQRRSMYLEEYQKSLPFANDEKLFDLQKLIGDVDPKKAVAIGTLILGIYAMLRD